MNYRRAYTMERNVDLPMNYVVTHTNVDRTVYHTKVHAPNVEVPMRLAYTDGNAAVVDVLSSTAFDRRNKHRSVDHDPRVYLYDY
ncbi:unnamed protein product [Trichobilharzia szidati]|nr:unnamed protein product [Trichobilharzia szidati]